MSRRFIHPDGFINQAAVDTALSRRFAHYVEFSRHIPGVVSADEWMRDVYAALLAEIEVELRRHNRRTKDGR